MKFLRANTFNSNRIFQGLRHFRRISLELGMKKTQSLTGLLTPDCATNETCCGKKMQQESQIWCILILFVNRLSSYHKE